jgi:hypothetical protein
MNFCRYLSDICRLLCKIIYIYIYAHNDIELLSFVRIRTEEAVPSFHMGKVKGKVGPVHAMKACSGRQKYSSN